MLNLFPTIYGIKSSELSAGIYNVLNSTSRRHLSVKQFVDAVNSYDAGMEANLSAVLQSVRGNKQFWFLKKSDVMAMIREFGSPTLFLLTVRPIG